MANIQAAAVLRRHIVGWAVVALVLACGCLSPLTAQPLQGVKGVRPVATPGDTTPEQPFLRIDAEFHTQVVNRFAQDPAGRIIVTASDDKTVRIWKASDGGPLATLRVPIADGDEGAIYAVAISPDGKTLLVGGYTGVTWDRSFAIYIFDLESQRLRGRLPNLPAAVNHLAYSPDGRMFAVALAGLGGMRLVDATDGSLIGSDETFRDRATWVDFDRSGRLAVASFDGDVRLYDAAGKRLARRAPVPGAHPYSVAFSPDGSAIAVGYADQPRVELLSAQDLSPRPALRPAAGRPQTGGLGAVAWAANGGLFAGGSLRDGSGTVVLRYWPPGRGSLPVDKGVLRDTIFQVAATNDGGLLLVGADPALMRLDRAGQVVFRNEGPGPDFRDMADQRFAVSQDGLSVTVQTKTMMTPWLVDMGQRSVSPVPPTRGLTPVAAPPAAAPVTVHNWRNTASPRIGGQTIRLEPEELCRSYAVRPAQDFVVLGTDYQIRVFTASGELADAAALPGAAWAVGVSGDGRTLVAAVGDGTLRWFGLDERGHLTPRITLFLAADRVRWVAWTPGGYFDHSDRGGKDLVGLLLNRARNQPPDWFSFAQVYRLFYAPDAVAGRLRGDDTPEPAGGIAGLRGLLGRDAPPGIDLDSVCWTVAGAQQCRAVSSSGVSRGLRVNESADATVPANVGSLQLRYHLVGNIQGESAVDVFVNGRNAGRAAPRQAEKGVDAVVEQSVPLDSGANQVQLRAYGRDQAAYAQSRLIQIARSASASPAAAVEGAKPKLFILSVGVDHYPATINSLNFAVADARAVARAIKAHVPASYRGVEMTELYDDAASKTGVLAALDTIAKAASTADTVVIYLSGHGISIEGRYYFVTQNVGSVEAVPTAALSEAALVQALAKVQARNGLVFLDTCHAGAFSLDTASQIAHESGRYVLAASASLEEALDSYDDRNGVFATAVLRGLAGGALSGSETTVNNFGLGFFVTPLVHSLAVERHHAQTARFKIAAEDAQPFAIVDAEPTR